MKEKRILTLKEIAEEDKRRSEEMHQIAEDFRDQDDWANQPRAVYSGEAMERELDELFPVKVGVEALQERRRMIEEAKKLNDRQIAINTLEAIIANCPDIFPGDLLEIRDTLKRLHEGGEFSPQDIVIMSRNALMDQKGMDILQSEIMND